MASAEVVTNKEKLIKACAGKIAENIERQLSQIAFFNQDNQGQVRAADEVHLTKRFWM